MRELKNREVIAGLILLILLGTTAIVLIIKKEIGNKDVVTNDTYISSQEIEEDIESNIAKDSHDDISYVNSSDADNNKEDELEQVNRTENMTESTTVLDKYVAASMKEYKTDDWQMKELFYYWDEYQLDAVEDLIRLERVRAITNELSGTNDFYYYGDKDVNGQPNGKGLAIYANNTYYCGEWKNGKRSGEGMWLRLYPDKTATIGKSSGVVEHLYNGMFENDYPNGAGQEHIEYDLEVLNNNEAITNVIGNFKDGYYDSELYIMTISKEGRTTDWYADAKKGTFTLVEDKVSTTGKNPVWERGETVEDSNEMYYWMLPSLNKNFGISGLKK